MRHYEVTFIVDPVLSGDEIKSTAKTYQDMLVTEGCNIIHVDEMGLKQLAYSINKRSSGIYYTVEFEISEGDIIPKLELALRRDERIMRFLTVKLDKYGVKYNEDKRQGLIGKVVKKEKKDKGNDRGRSQRPPAKTPKPAAPAVAATAAATAPAVEAIVKATPEVVATPVVDAAPVESTPVTNSEEE